MTEIEKLMTPEEVAEVFRIGKSTVYHMAERGTIPAIKIGGSVRFSPKALRDYLERLGKSGRCLSSRKSQYFEMSGAPPEGEK